MSYVFPKSKAELDAALFLGKIKPKRYRVNHYHYMESLCVHIDCVDLKTQEVLLPETVYTYFGKPAWDLAPEPRSED